MSISSEESSPHVVDFSKVPSEYAYFLSVSFVTGMGLGVWGGICWEGKPRVFGFAVRPALLVLIGGMGRRPFGESSCGCAEMYVASNVTCRWFRNDRSNGGGLPGAAEASEVGSCNLKVKKKSNLSSIRQSEAIHNINIGDRAHQRRPSPFPLLFQ